MGSNNSFVPWSPHTLWNALLLQYGSNLSGWDRYMLNYNSMGMRTVRNGTDYGKPRYNMNAFNLIMLLLAGPSKACVTIQGPKGPDTACE